MYYKFNGITQRISSSPQEVSMGRPVSAETFSKPVKEEPKINYEYQTQSARQASQAVSPSSVRPGHYPVPSAKGYKKFMELQTLFTANDGKFVWQKLPKDMPLYYLSVGMVVAGTALTAYTLAKMASPPKND